jgi:hypothetical protein
VPPRGSFRTDLCSRYDPSCAVNHGPSFDHVVATSEALYALCSKVTRQGDFVALDGMAVVRVDLESRALDRWSFQADLGRSRWISALVPHAPAVPGEVLCIVATATPARRGPVTYVLEWLTWAWK